MKIAADSAVQQNVLLLGFQLYTSCSYGLGPMGIAARV